jgi:hypothetical protein
MSRALSSWWEILVSPVLHVIQDPAMAASERQQATTITPVYPVVGGATNYQLIMEVNTPRWGTSHARHAEIELPSRAVSRARSIKVVPKVGVSKSRLVAVNPMNRPGPVHTHVLDGFTAGRRELCCHSTEITRF